jgi:hypothetical protein
MNHLDYVQAKLAEAQEQIKTLRDAGGGEQDFVRLALEALECAVRYELVVLRELVVERGEHPAPAPAVEPSRRPSDEWGRGDQDAWRPWPVVVRDIDAKLDRLLALERHVTALGDSYHAMIGLLERLGPRG